MTLPRRGPRSPVRTGHAASLATRRLPLLGIAVLLSVGSGAVPPGRGDGEPGIAGPPRPRSPARSTSRSGDSFTADWGVDPVAADQPSTGCRQSTNDYPHQVAANLGLKLTDVSCAGALTTNMTQPQTTFPDGLTHPAAPPQFDALTSTTEIVTIGIGGNDFGFGDIARRVRSTRSPATSSATAGRTTTPPARTTTTPAVSRRTTRCGNALTRSSVPGPAPITAIKTRSSQAAVFFVDYLALAPDQAHAPNPATYPDSCYVSLLYSQAFPFGAADTVYIAALEVLFNHTVDAADHQAGATVVSPTRRASPTPPATGRRTRG